MKRRECKCGCGLSLAGRRSDAVWYSRAHAMAARRAPSTHKGRTRRLNRDGLGTKLYLTPSELADLELHLPHLSLPVAEKVKQARVRLDQRRMNGDRDSGATAAHAGP